MSDSESGSGGDWDDDDYEPPTIAAVVAKKFDEEEEEPEPIWEGDGKWKGFTMIQLAQTLDDLDQKLREARKPVDGAKAKRRAIKEKEAEDRVKREKEAELQAAMKTETPEEAFARKQAIQKKVEAEDEKLGLELMGGVGDANIVDVTLIEAMEPKSQGDFQEMAKKVAKKATKYNASPFYTEFIKELSIHLTEPLNDVETRKWQTQLSVIANEKTKAVKGAKKKKSNKPSLSSGKGGGIGSEFDDFMF